MEKKGPSKKKEGGKKNENAIKNNEKKGKSKEKEDGKKNENEKEIKNNEKKSKSKEKEDGKKNEKEKAIKNNKNEQANNEKKEEEIKKIITEKKNHKVDELSNNILDKNDIEKKDKIENFGNINKNENKEVENGERKMEIEENSEDKKDSQQKNEKNDENNHKIKDDAKKINEKDINKENELDLKNIKIYPKGLNNIGATCYMNSVLQCLYHIYELSNEFLKLKELDIKKMPISWAFLDIIKNLSFSQKESISPIKFKEIISNNELFEGIEANDSKTLTLYILDNINEEFNENNVQIPNKKISSRIRELNEKGTEGIVKFFNMQCNSIIGDLFNGVKKFTYKCLKCNEVSVNYQIFNIINLSVEKTYYTLYKNKKNKKKKLDLLECFRNEELPKYFNGKNQVYCDKCKKEENGESYDKIYMTPKVMILFLDRGINNRFTCEVSFPENLNISEFEEKTIGKGEYILIGVIEHLGPSSNAGHFIANCRNFDGKWYIFSDSTIKGPLNKYKSYGVPYLLFYTRNE